MRELMFLILLIPQCAVAGESLKRYALESGTVDYVVSGSSSGTETLRWSHWGDREVRETHTAGKVMGIPQRQNSLTILQGVWQYQIDLDQRSGTKMKNPMLESMQEQGHDPQEVGREMLKSMGGRMIGTDVVLGRSCELWEVANVGTRTCIWNGIALKTQANVLGMISMNTVATRIDDSARHSDEVFALPGDVKFTETTMPQAAGQGGKKAPDLKSIFESLGNPEP